MTLRFHRLQHPDGRPSPLTGVRRPRLPNRPGTLLGYVWRHEGGWVNSRSSQVHATRGLAAKGLR